MKQALVGSILLSAPAIGAAQALPPTAASEPAPLLLKVGLRLTHLHYAHDSKAWQLLLPLSLGAEYRLAPRFSVYGQGEVDMLTSYTANRRRNAQLSSVPNATLSAGLRYYYGQAKTADLRPAGPEFGKYLALDGAADWQQLSPAGAAAGRRRQVPTALTPAVYALWGIQNRLLPHVLYDLNAGLGVLAPAHYYNFERVGGTTHWNVGAQVNIRLYLAY